MQRLVRAGASVLALGAVGLAIFIPIYLAVQQARTRAQYPNYPLRLSSLVGTWLVAVVLSVFLVSLAYFSIRLSFLDSRKGSSYWLDRLFGGLGVASTAVIFAAVLSQVALLILAAISIRHFSSNLRNAVTVRWTPAVWEAVRDSPYFLILALLLFVVGFYWQYRKDAQAKQA